MAYPQTTFRYTKFSRTSFIGRRREVVNSESLLYQLEVLKKTGRYEAFKLQWHPSYNDEPDFWPVPNHLFWDSDVAKWIEGACYFLKWRDNDEINAAVLDLVEMIRGAQQQDGYLNIHFTVVEPKKRFTNLRDLHELYNAGHLIEAALAHSQLYENNLLLEPIIAYVDLLCQVFGPGQDQKHGYPGHPEIELALLRLFEKTKDVKHLNLARYFLEERGNPRGQDGRHYYDVEAEARGDRENEMPVAYPKKKSYWYQQAHKPIIEQESIEGHAVRAMYLLTAAADLVRVEESNFSKSVKGTVKRLWENMVEKKMYLTGGIGAQKQWEGFGIDYFLPQGTDDGGCYSETCAAIGVTMLAERLIQIDLDGKYGDILELCFFNAVMTGMSTSGRHFTYVNQLASSDTDLSKRAEWFTCACCPPNVTRLLGYIGGFLWTFDVDECKKSVQVNVHLFESVTIKIPVGKGTLEIKQKSNWPWEGDIDFEVNNCLELSTTIRLRIPKWACDWEISPSPPTTHLQKGYLAIPSDWLALHPKFRLSIPLKPRLISPHPYANQDIVAIARGPIVYCVEDFDNPWVDDHFKALCFDPTATISETFISESAIGEPYVALTAHDAAYLLDVSQQAAPNHQFGAVNYKQQTNIKQLHFIPYHLRDNRGGRGHMRVGLRRKH